MSSSAENNVKKVPTYCFQYVVGSNQVQACVENKEHDEDPKSMPIFLKEALDLIAEKLNKTDDQGLLNEPGYPQVTASFGGGCTPTTYTGTFLAFLASWGLWA